MPTKVISSHSQCTHVHTISTRAEASITSPIFSTTQSSAANKEWDKSHLTSDDYKCVHGFLHIHVKWLAVCNFEYS